MKISIFVVLTWFMLEASCTSSGSCSSSCCECNGCCEKGIPNMLLLAEVGPASEAILTLDRNTGAFTTVLKVCIPYI